MASVFAAKALSIILHQVGTKKDQREEKWFYQGNCNLQSVLFMWTDMVSCRIFIMLLQKHNKAKGFATAEEEIKKVVVQQG